MTKEKWLFDRVAITENGCWEWKLTKERPPSLPYGRCYFGSRYKMAHRVVWEKWNEAPIPSGMCVCHTCDNPPCCNPSHLFLGTIGDNNSDRHKKGRDAKGERSGRRTCPESFSGMRGDNHWTRRMKDKVLRGEQSGRAKLNFKLAKTIRDEHSAGMKLSQLASKYGVGTSTIHRTVRGETWGGN